MPMLSERDLKAIRDHLDKNLKGDVTIDFFTQKESTLAVPATECMYCKETGELLAEVTATSPRLRLNTYDFVADEAAVRQWDIPRIPAFTLRGAAKGRVRYLGIPSGYEFSALVEDLVDVGNGRTDLAPKLIDELAALDKDVHIQVFSTPT